MKSEHLNFTNNLSGIHVREFGSRPGRDVLSLYLGVTKLFTKVTCRQQVATNSQERVLFV